MYIKEKQCVLLAIFGGAIMMKTEKLTHAVRNPEHITTMKIFLLSTKWRNISMAWSLDTLVLMCLQGHVICDIFFH